MIPQISIGLPVYNAEATIRDSLDSLLAQEGVAFELIVCDNASTDRTMAICADYAARDARVRVCPSEINRGASWNFKRAFDQARGGHFMWAGSHDRWQRGHLRACTALLDAEPSVALVYPKPRWMREDGSTYDAPCEPLDTRGKSRVERVRAIVRDLRKGDMVYGLYRADILRRCRLGIPCPGSDHVLLMEVSLHGEIAMLPNPTFLRLEPRKTPSTAHYIGIQLMRLDPVAATRRNVRRYWEMGWQHLVGIGHAKLGLADKVSLMGAVAWEYGRRYRVQLKDEWRHPLFPNGIAAELGLPSY